MKWINAFLCYRQQRVVVNGVKSDWVPIVSGVPQGTVLGPLLFSLHINGITADIESEIMLFADDCVCYREIKDKEDTLKFQRDIDRLGNWARKWGMRFQPVKCNMMRPILEYGSSVRDPHSDKLQEELEKVQNRAARFVTRNYVYETGSMTGILGQLKWESLKKRRKDNRLILLYKGLKGKAMIPTDYLIPKTRRGRNQHSLAFQIPSAT